MYYLLASTVKAVCALFAQGLSHKDIKGDNFVFLDGQSVDGELLGLIDYGYCINASASSSNKSGTAQYSPPEAFWEGEGTINTEKFDVFSLGVLFITLIFQDWAFYKEGAGYKCINDDAYREFFMNETLALDDRLKFFSKKWSKTCYSKDARILILIARMIDYNPINRPSLDKVLTEPSIQQYL